MKTITPKFTDTIPELIEEGILYISIKYGSVVHLCICGCKKVVVTPLSPTDWKLIYNGETVSLYPSIGNWNFECESHYWITENEIRLAKKWSKNEVLEGREQDAKTKKRFFQFKTKKN